MDCHQGQCNVSEAAQKEMEIIAAQVAGICMELDELDGLDGNAVVRRHAWQPSEVGPDVILATTNADGTSYFLHDANKSVMQATGGNGEALGQYAYAPFGEPLDASPARIGFSSELFDASVRLAYYNYRHLAPGLGRWLGRDAIGEEGGVNLYAFVNNNVINNFDAQGNKPYQARDRIDEKRYYISNHKCYDRECVKERTKSLIVYLAGLSIPTATSTASDFLGFIESTSAKIISRTITFFGGISCIIGIINFDTEGPCEVEMARCQKQNRNVENNDPDRWVFE